MKNVFFTVLALVFLVSLCWALPEAPKNMSGQVVSDGFLLSWEHPGGEDVYFHVYRGETKADAELIASTSEKIFLDQGFEEGNAYVYFVSALDEDGETLPLTSVDVAANPFVINLIEPSGTSFKAGQNVDFIVEIESDRFEELMGLKVVLINESLGLREDFLFNSGDKRFYLTTKLPEMEEFGQGLATTYIIEASADIGEDRFIQRNPTNFLIAPDSNLNLWQLALNFLTLFGPIFLLLFVAATITRVWWKWSLKHKARMDELRLDLLELHKQRKIWKDELFKRRITPAQFKEKEAALQGQIAAIEEKLGKQPEKGKARPDPFQGYSPAEAKEVMLIVRSKGKPGKGETQDSFRARLVGLGRAEKVAKKAAELVFRK